MGGAARVRRDAAGVEALPEPVGPPFCSRPTLGRHAQTRADFAIELMHATIAGRQGVIKSLKYIDF